MLQRMFERTAARRLITTLVAALSVLLFLLATVPSHSGAARVPYKTLSDGHRIPTVALGVFRVPPGSETYESVRSALARGYRHIDTAQGYNNEASVGRALVDSAVPRSEIFLTTKLSSVWRRSDVTYNVTMETLRLSLAKLQTTYLDLYLIHCPLDRAHRLEQWRALVDAQAAGLVRSIGVSDYGVQQRG
jgi:diketogulonate reductase-like aldo/keto reductase